MRDLYAVDEDKLLVIQTDRLSAFDVILPDPIPGKGRVLTEMSFFWFKKLGHVIPNHLTGIAPESVVAPEERAQVAGRAMVVQQVQAADDRGGGARLHHRLGLEGLPEDRAWCAASSCPRGCKEAQKLPEVIFTPATKAPAGQHDENISYAEAEKIVGAELAAKVRDGVDTALQRGRRVRADARASSSPTPSSSSASTTPASSYLIDEILTPDSSRFWPAAEYRIGMSPPSFDKQIVRDWLETQPWNKKPPAPRLPADVLKKTSDKYREVLQLLSG